MNKNIWVFFVNLFMYSVVKQVWDPMFYVVWQVLVIICFYSESWEHKRRHTFRQVWKKSKYCQCDNKSLAKSWLGWGPLGLRRSSPGRWTWRLRCGAGSCGRGGCSPWSSGSRLSTSSPAPSSRSVLHRLPGWGKLPLQPRCPSVRRAGAETGEGTCPFGWDRARTRVRHGGPLTLFFSPSGLPTCRARGFPAAGPRAERGWRFSLPPRGVSGGIWVVSTCRSGGTWRLGKVEIPGR